MTVDGMAVFNRIVYDLRGADHLPENDVSEVFDLAAHFCVNININLDFRILCLIVCLELDQILGYHFEFVLPIVKCIIGSSVFQNSCEELEEIYVGEKRSKRELVDELWDETCSWKLPVIVGLDGYLESIENPITKLLQSLKNQSDMIRFILIQRLVSTKGIEDDLNVMAFLFLLLESCSSMFREVVDFLLLNNCFPLFVSVCIFNPTILVFQKQGCPILALRALVMNLYHICSNHTHDVGVITPFLNAVPQFLKYPVFGAEFLVLGRQTFSKLIRMKEYQPRLIGNFKELLEVQAKAYNVSSAVIYRNMTLDVLSHILRGVTLVSQFTSQIGAFFILLLELLYDKSVSQSVTRLIRAFRNVFKLFWRYISICTLEYLS
jgi:hypothetical protein